MSEAYKDAGVDVEAGYEAVRRMKKHVETTFIPGVLSGLGEFGGRFELPGGMTRPVLVSGTDGVGTKLKLAFLLDRHDTIGIDCVAMCANDVACAGARPLFFLDYIACGKNRPAVIEQIVAGLSTGCREATCALIGGETAEMPGFYPEDEYDLAGFCVGIVDYDRQITTARVQPGDVLLGLRSSGVHSNGFSLVRRLFSEKELMSPVDELGQTLAEALLTPTRIYVPQMLRVQDYLHGAAHITGGGFYENIPRILPPGLRAAVRRDSVPTLPLFERIRAQGKLSDEDMFGTFNMGLGLTLCVSESDVSTVMGLLQEINETPVVMGVVEPGDGGFRFV